MNYFNKSIDHKESSIPAEVQACFISEENLIKEISFGFLVAINTNL